MNLEKRQARAKHQKRLHSLEVAYKKRRKGKRFILKVIEKTVKEEVENAADTEGKEDSKKNEINVQD